MNITIDLLKKTIKKLNYTWYEDRPNIIGIRTKLDIPDVFNDLLAVVYKEAGVETMKVFCITADPGVFYQKNILNSQGCAIIEPGQWVNAYSIGFHKGYDGTKMNPKTNTPYPAHRALILTGHIMIKRDADKNGIAGDSGVVMKGDGTGCNIHGAMRSDITRAIGPWSAGCQVFAAWKEKETFIDICEKYRNLVHNKFTYTLVKEEQLTA
jgi:hypothetical protein